MSKHEYICLACGNYYLYVPSAMSDAEDKKCPKCDSANVMRLSMSKLFGFTGGGGG